MKPWYCRHITLYISIPGCYKVPVGRKQHCMLVGGFRDLSFSFRSLQKMIQCDGSHMFQVGWNSTTNIRMGLGMGEMFDTFGVPFSLDHNEICLPSTRAARVPPLKMDGFPPGFVTRSLFLRYILNCRGFFWRAVPWSYSGASSWQQVLENFFSIFQVFF